MRNEKNEKNESTAQPTYVLWLENYFARRRHVQSITVGQRQCLIVIQHRIQILNPNAVDWTVEHQPNEFICTSFKQ